MGARGTQKTPNNNYVSVLNVEDRMLNALIQGLWTTLYFTSLRIVNLIHKDYIQIIILMI